MNKKQIEEILNSLMRTESVHLVDIEIRGNESYPVIEVFVDTEKGITIQECETLNRKIAAVLDETDDFPVKYRLDISSPGIDRPLLHDWQFKKNVGRDLFVDYVNLNEENIQVEGLLEGIEGNIIKLNVQGNPVEILKEAIKTAKVKPKWS